MSNEEKETLLRQLLSTMDLPSGRIENFDKANLHWLQRNIFIRNGKNPNLDQATNMITEMIREEYRKKVPTNS